MKMLKKIAIPVLLLTVLSLCIVLTSCKKECAHEYGEWTVTKAATCTEDGEQTHTCSICGETETEVIAASHALDNLLCGECGEEIVGAEALVPEIDPTSLSTVGVVVKNVKIAGDSGDYSQVITCDLAELVIYADENGMLRGYGEGTASVAYTQNGAETPVVQNMGAVVVLEGDTIYVEANSAGQYAYYTASLSAMIESNPEVAEAIAMVETYLPSIEAWINESLIPCFTAPTLPEGVEIPEVTEADAKRAATAVLDLFFNVETTADGATVALDLSIIKDVNNTLNEKTVAQLIDAIAGEGAFLQLQGFLPAILNYSVDNFISFLTLNLGVDVPALLTALDELAVIITGSEEATFEALVGIEGSIEDILADEEFLATTVRDILMMALELTEETELDAMIAQVITTLNTTTLYQLLEVDAAIPAQINSTVDMLAEMLSYEITVGKDGRFVSSTLKLNVPEQALYLTATLTAEKLVINANDGEAGTNNIDAEIVINHKMVIDETKIAETKGYFENLADVEDVVALTDYIPVYDENDVLVAVIRRYHSGWEQQTVAGENGDEIQYTTTAHVQVIELGVRVAVSVTPAEGSVAYDYGYAARSADRTYTISEEEYNSITDLDEYINSLVTAEVNYIYEIASGNASASIRFYFDPVSGEIYV